MHKEITCVGCGERFHLGPRAKWAKYCPPCRPIRMAELQAVENAKKRARCRAIRDEALGDGCARCGEGDRRVLQFHHVDPSTKSFTIANGTQSPARLRREIAKCVVLCANCHIIVERERDAPGQTHLPPDTRPGGPVDVPSGHAPNREAPPNPRSHLA